MEYFQLSISIVYWADFITYIASFFISFLLSNNTQEFIKYLLVTFECFLLMCIIIIIIIIIMIIMYYLIIFLHLQPLRLHRFTFASLYVCMAMRLQGFTFA